MGAFNEIVDAFMGTCPACGRDGAQNVQFAFGDTWQYRYRVGDRITWGGNDIGEPGHAAVVADGYGTACPACGADEWLNGSYDVHFEHDVIASVEPASGRYDFLKSHTSYLVLEE